MGRIKYLDGHRGIAVLLVALFHAFSRWPEIIPYGYAYADFPVFRYGFLGVQLFFLISGYVILMTLEKCKGAGEFIYKRWLRLFPAMLLCTLFIFLTAGFFHERPFGSPRVRDTIPGLSFMDPYILQQFTGIPFLGLEGAFWSLYVEMKFYLFAAAAYYLVGSRLFILATFLCFLGASAFELLNHHFDNSTISAFFALTNHAASFEYFGWFAAGSAFYMYAKGQEKAWYVYALSMGLITAIISADLHVAGSVAALLVTLLFSASIVSESLQNWLSNPFFIFFGFISYPFYLIHENMMVSLIIKFDGVLPIPSILLPVAAIGIVCGTAYPVAKFGEGNIKMLIRSTVDRMLVPQAGK